MSNFTKHLNGLANLEENIGKKVAFTSASERIVELKKERDEFHDSLVTVELLVSDYRIANAELEKERDELYDKLAMASLLCKPESLEAHILEQRAIGIENVAEMLFVCGKISSMAHGESFDIAADLRNQAKAIKDNK